VSRAASRPTRRVIALGVLLALSGVVLWLVVEAHPIAAPVSTPIPWWALALMFAATEIWVFHLQVGREAQSISISELPLVLALFYATPDDVLLARIVGPGLVMLMHRRQTLLKAGVNVSLTFADTALALAVFRLVGGGSTGDGWREWAGAVLACGVAMALDLVVLDLIIRWYVGTSSLPGMRGFALGVGMATATALVALVPVLTLRQGGSAAVPLLVSGAILLFSYRAYTSLADRHNSLELLFRFTRELSVVPGNDQVLPSVLNQARELLRAEAAEVVRFGQDEAGTQPGVWHFDGTVVRPLLDTASIAAVEAARSALGSSDAVLLKEDEAGSVYLRLRGAHETILAPLRYDGQTVGALAVHDRLGEVRGFSTADIQLLQTIASHASVALHNEMLVGRLRHEALHDQLTGLPNRAQLLSRATSVLSEARLAGGDVALAIIDLNGFKVVNDTLGHHVGDELLRAAAERFAAVRPVGVTVARLGGDEFAVLVPSETGLGGEEVARMLLTALDKPFEIGEERLQLSGSAGLALAPSHGRRVSDLLKRADIAMYAAKNGPDGVVVYRPDIDLNDASLLSLMGELREAISTGQLDIEVEPVFDLHTGEIVSAEALARWHHPTRGTLRPALFLPLAERNGLIAPLTSLVLQRAISACASWRAAGLDIGVSVNLSARSLLDSELPNTVAEALACWDVPAEQLTLEITESIVLSDADRALELLRHLRHLGVRISLDDFGTGYSSLTHLSELPIQQLKIDRSFVSQVHGAGKDRAIVAAIGNLARHLELEVVAEGIEAPETAELLARLGCGYGQGHLFAESMSPALLPLWLKSRAMPLPRGVEGATAGSPVLKAVT
jgi:diguanylate cyclase (GGDEF)-like protein